MIDTQTTPILKFEINIQETDGVTVPLSSYELFVTNLFKYGT